MRPSALPTTLSKKRQLPIDELTEREVFGILRRRAGVTQRDLQRACGLSQPRISTWERGGVESDRVVTLLWETLERLVDDADASSAVA